MVRHQHSPGLISSLPRTAELPPFISFSTSSPEPSFAGRRPMRLQEMPRHHSPSGALTGPVTRPILTALLSWIVLEQRLRPHGLRR